MVQFYSRNDTIFNGDVYSIPFSYSKKDEIRVYIDDEAYSHWEFLNDSQIKLTVLPEEVTSETIVSVRRITDITKPVVEYTNNTMLSKEALNLSQNQLINAVQEIYDNNIQFNIDTIDLIGGNKADVEAEFEAYRQQTNATIAQNKADVEAEFGDFTDDINTKIERVNEAADKLEALDAAVATATEKAEIATNKATEVETNLETAIDTMDGKLDDAATAVTNANAAAELATQKAQEAQTTADTMVSVITEAFEAADTALQAQITELQFISTKVYSEELNFLRAGSTHTSLKIAKNTVLNLDGGFYLKTTEDLEFDVTDKLDEGTIQAAKDYSVYLVKTANDDFDIVVSLNATYPTDYDAETAYKIGGFHTLCREVTSANAPVLKTGSFWTTHPAIGYDTGDIIPNSVWCLTHRPVSDPSGMAYIDRLGKWIDIYLQSGTFQNTASVYQGTTTDTRQPILHQLDMACVFKKMLTDNDFLVAAEGSNQLTAIAGSADAVTTGGHLDTAGKRMISGYFLEDCCGFLWQWLDEIGFNGNSNWTGYGTGAAERGETYGMPYVLLAGGDWDNSSHCGSWSRICSPVRSNVYAFVGCRGASRSLFIGKVA